MATNIPHTSFINLFSEIVYDKSQIAQKSLDIWDAYQIRNITRNSKRLPTYLYRPSETDTLPGIARYAYKTDRLWWVTLIVNDVEDPFTFLDDVVKKNLNNGLINLLKSQYVPDLVYEMKRVKAINDELNEKNTDG
jgi:hypothetical protein